MLRYAWIQFLLVQMDLKFEDIDWMTEEAKTLAEYWRRLQGGDVVPRRSDFDPAEIRSILPGIGIYEVKSPETILIRLAGTSLVEIFGQEITGQNFIDFWPQDLKFEAGRVLSGMVEKPSGLLVRIHGETVGGKVAPGVSVGFPLRDQDDQCNMLVFHTGSTLLPMARDSRADQITSLVVDRRLFIDIENW